MARRTFTMAACLVFAVSSAWAAMDDLPGVPVSITETINEQAKPKDISLTPKFKASGGSSDALMPPGSTLAGASDIEDAFSSQEKSQKKQKEQLDKSLFSSTKVGLNIIPGENMILPVSVLNPNRLVTPFSKPRVTTASEADIAIDSSVVYVTPADEKIITMFVTDEEGNQRDAISLTMVPRKIPPREVRLLLTDEQGKTYGQGASGGALYNSGQASEWEKGSPYMDAIRDTMRELALGKAPQGYGLRSFNASDPVPHCQDPRLSVQPGQALDGHNIIAVVSILTNVSDEPVKFRAASCYRRGILAAAAWPKTFLAPGESVELYTLFKRPDPAEDASVRPSLLSNGVAR